MHLLTIGGAFLLAYYLRLIRDFIPRLQLRIPSIDADELMIFVAIALITFLIIAYQTQLYRINITKDQPTMFQTRWIWLISIACIAYLGFGFVFVNGVSRIIIISAGIFTLVGLVIIDWLWSRYYDRYITQHARIAVYSHDPAQYQQFLLRNDISSTMMTNITTIDDLASFHALIIIDELDANHLETLIDTTRGYHIPVIYLPTTDSIAHTLAISGRYFASFGRELLSSTMDLRSQFIKRIFDIVASGI